MDIQAGSKPKPKRTQKSSVNTSTVSCRLAMSETNRKRCAKTRSKFCPSHPIGSNRFRLPLKKMTHQLYCTPQKPPKGPQSGVLVESLCDQNSDPNCTYTDSSEGVYKVRLGERGQ